MNKDQKAAVVDEVAAAIKSAEAVFAVDYRGISVHAGGGAAREAERGRRDVSRGQEPLTLRAAEKAGDEPCELLEGPTALTFVHGDVALAAKVINDFRQADELRVQGRPVGGDALSAEQIDAIAKLPARDVLNAPAGGHDRLAAHRAGARPERADRGLCRIQLPAIADQGLVSGEAPAPRQLRAEAAPAGRGSRARGGGSRARGGGSRARGGGSRARRGGPGRRG